MIKLLLGIAVVVFTSFCGYVLAKRYRQKQLFFRQFYTFNERFLNEISYYRRPLHEFVKRYSYKDEFNELLRIFFNVLEEKRLLFKDILDNQEFDFLNQEEKVVVSDYFLMLGKGDSASQKKYFTAMRDTLMKLQREAENSCENYAGLYIKIGFLLGLLILILIL
jgi:stage III sporulation protein AB